MLQREKPTSRNQRRFLKYIYQAKPVFDTEMGFTHHADDFVALTTRKQDTWSMVFFKGLAHRMGSQTATVYSLKSLLNGGHTDGKLRRVSSHDVRDQLPRVSLILCTTRQAGYLFC